MSRCQTASRYRTRSACDIWGGRDEVSLCGSRGGVVLCTLVPRGVPKTRIPGCPDFAIWSARVRGSSFDAPGADVNVRLDLLSPDRRLRVSPSFLLSSEGCFSINGIIISPFLKYLKQFL